MKKVFYLSIVALIVPATLLFSCGEPAKGNKSGVAVLQKNSLVDRGKYLVTTIGCNDCHSPKSLGPNGPEIITNRMLSGYPDIRPLPKFPEDVLKKGLVVMSGDLTAAAGPWGTSFAANLTPDDTGIGNWTEAQFKNALTHGKFKGLDGSRTLMPPMPWQNYTHMNDGDIKAIFAYLKSIPAVKNIVPPYRPAKRSS
ncbi:c-type cytochrome [Mucilaginibacter terrae]|uniref:Mono/diheme cytochrome c family protein n=1 Tax=Mucilaginibacter terrae TaxID=1955052 RepID=A0ABU3GRE8_9SPHI|nr:c-type cytochrome [Mucilaginibacter terrae]MDT3402354.1 mono/diheme cytochrome c family protein [Mucilaginibacter terrae]